MYLILGGPLLMLNFDFVIQQGAITGSNGLDTSNLEPLVLQVRDRFSENLMSFLFQYRI